MSMELNSKWFRLKGPLYFCSKREAVTEEEAWEKTIEKWILKDLIGLRDTEASATCGLCNIARRLFREAKPFRNSSSCYYCPIYRITGHTLCLVEGNQIFFLLMMQAAWKEGGL